MSSNTIQHMWMWDVMRDVIRWECVSYCCTREWHVIRHHPSHVNVRCNARWNALRVHVILLYTHCTSYITSRSHVHQYDTHSLTHQAHQCPLLPALVPSIYTRKLCTKTIFERHHHMTCTLTLIRLSDTHQAHQFPPLPALLASITCEHYSRLVNDWAPRCSVLQCAAVHYLLHVVGFLKS